MYKIHQIFLCLLFGITLIKSYNISSCVPNSSCQCYITQYSFQLINCSHTLIDLPIVNFKNIYNITKILARNAFIQWPRQLCKYSNIQILDLSGSFFNFEFIDLTCLNYLIHLNLSNTQINKIPNLNIKKLSNHLQILDLSNNHIKIINGIDFQSLNNLISLFLQNNPIEYIEHLENFFYLSNIELINLISSNLDIILKQSLTNNQWINIAKQWKNSTKFFLIRMNNIPLELILPNSNQFDIISNDLMKIILKTLINSTFITLYNTPKCNCIHLKNYQKIFSFIDYKKKYSSSLFQTTKCFMPDGITYARLFDRRTYIDLKCPLLGKISFFSSLHNSSSTINNIFRSFFYFLFIFIVLKTK